MMKVLMLNTYDERGGAAKAAFRLNKGVRGLGIDSQLLVQRKTLDTEDVVGPKNSLARIVYGIRSVLGTMPVRFYPHKPINNFSPALMPDFLAGKVETIAPDLVHLHWLGAGFMRLETLPKIKQPLVWTLHDSWPFTGGCHMPYECVRYRESCGFCPVLGSSHENDLSRWTWQRKSRAFRGLNLTVVTPSRWLADCAGTSSLFRDRRIEVIPNGLDLSIFKPTDKQQARDLLGLPQNRKFILFGGISSTDDPNKGFQLLLPALRRLVARGGQDDTELVVFGSAVPENPPDFGMKVHYLGRLYDDVRLALVYVAADLFIAPSLQENLPYTVMEAMACGTPCVAFNQGGVSDLIDHEVTGYLARPFVEEDLARGIAWLLINDEIRQEVSLRCRRKVEERFALAKVAARYVELYGSIRER
jgi:glycosyltransferase involved in cell wall biosynthesis